VSAPPCRFPGRVLLSRATYGHSTIGAGGLNCRVRDGNGCFTSAMTTGNFNQQLNVGSSNMALNLCARSGLYRCIRRSDKQLRMRSRNLPTLDKLVVKPHGRLVSVSSTPYSASTSDLSTSLSRRGLQGLTAGIPNLGVGFPLICFQRLSLPHMATRRCGWRHNRYTSGASVPVLSY
jgi:hypothetical protein